MATPAGLARRELFIDARDLQATDSGGQEMTIAEYRELLRTRGVDKLGEHQLTQSFDSTVRTRNPTYELGMDYDLGDTITVIDGRLGLTVNAVVESAQRSVSKSGESLILSFGYGLPTIYDKLKRKADA